MISKNKNNNVKMIITMQRKWPTSKMFGGGGGGERQHILLFCKIVYIVVSILYLPR